MVKKKKFSKGQNYKAVRQILSRHNVDMGELQASVSPAFVYLRGKLQKITGGDFHVEEIERMKFELNQFGQVKSELDNWNITGDTIHKIEKPTRE